MVKVETRFPPLSLWSTQKLQSWEKTISGSSSSCFLPPLLLHCPQVPPILKPHGLLISPKDPWFSPRPLSFPVAFLKAGPPKFLTCGDRCATGLLSRGTSSLGMEWLCQYWFFSSSYSWTISRTINHSTIVGPKSDHCLALSVNEWYTGPVEFCSNCWMVVVWIWLPHVFLTLCKRKPIWSLTKVSNHEAFALN